LLHLWQVLLLQLFGRFNALLESLLQQLRAHLPAAGVIAFGNVAEGVGGGEGEGHAGGCPPNFADRFAGHLAKQPADQLAAELFEIL
jgi:hypothetical protein